MNEPTPITFSWITKRGAHVITRLKWSELEAKTKYAFERRLNAEAWLEDNRTDIVAQVFKRGRKWVWWCEADSETIPW